MNRLMGNISVVRMAARAARLEALLTYRRIRHHWTTCLIQCGLSALALLVIILIVDVVLQAAIAVAIASTAFIVFVMPNSRAAAPRRVIGGHVVAVVVSMSLSALQVAPGFGEQVTESHVALDLVAASSVGLSILLMILTRTEHPPAAGTVLGLVIGGWPISTALLVLLGAVVLAVVHALTHRRLINLV